MTDIEDARDDLLSGLTVPRPPCLGLVSALSQRARCHSARTARAAIPKKL